ncbi:HD domain-containing protein, partial [Vibrio parahaemolyticus]|nr:HD domain-containing protein [Vibrio parahaemolyticus]
IVADALSIAEKRMGSSSFLRVAKEISLTHHEKWDGSGYPNQLSGEEIPLSGRLMALADVYDALISKRVYKPAFSHEKAREIILEGRGK